MPGTGASLLHRRARGGTGEDFGDLTTDFDFSSAADVFDKEKEKEKLAEMGGSVFAEPVKKYNPSSFFDELSCESLAPGSRGTNMSDERKKNSETFGMVGLQDNRRKNNRGRARRGQGGGQGGGNAQNNNRSGVPGAAGLPQGGANSRRGRRGGGNRNRSRPNNNGVTAGSG